MTADGAGVVRAGEMHDRRFQCHHVETPAERGEFDMIDKSGVN